MLLLPLFSHDRGVVKGVKKIMFVMALVEVFNFLVVVRGGMVQRMRDRYSLALLLGMAFAFKLFF